MKGWEVEEMKEGNKKVRDWQKLKDDERKYVQLAGTERC